MDLLSQEQILAAFKMLGLETEADREKFKRFTSPIRAGKFEDFGPDAAPLDEESNADLA